MKGCYDFAKGDTELRLGGGNPTGKQLQIVWKIPARFGMTNVLKRNFQYYGIVEVLLNLETKVRFNSLSSIKAAAILSIFKTRQRKG